MMFLLMIFPVRMIVVRSVFPSLARDIFRIINPAIVIRVCRRSGRVVAAEDVLPQLNNIPQKVRRILDDVFLYAWRDAVAFLTVYQVSRKTGC